MPGPWSLTGRDGDGGTLFSPSFEMDRFSDLGDAKAFTHLLPVDTVQRGVRPDGSFDPGLTALRSRGLPVAAEGR